MIDMELLEEINKIKAENTALKAVHNISIIVEILDKEIKPVHYGVKSKSFGEPK